MAKALRVSKNVVQDVRRKCSEQGLKCAIERKKRDPDKPPNKPKITGDVEAKVIALSCSEPPEGYKKWTIRLLASKSVELGFVESMSRTTANNILKKMN
ncbi:MAG: helix-turn-helix domain-containing protein [Eubacteriaceae bacterium]|nr:helix-turn-helix domain-containing protein [Eubacteriaceae bacterium]